MPSTRFLRRLRSLYGGKVENGPEDGQEEFRAHRRQASHAGFYVNVIFEGEPSLVNQLKTRFALNEEVFPA